MRLPLIKHIVDFIEQNDADYIEETISVLEHLTESSNIKDEEIDTSKFYMLDKQNKCLILLKSKGKPYQKTRNSKAIMILEKAEANILVFVVLFFFDL